MLHDIAAYQAVSDDATARQMVTHDAISKHAADMNMILQSILRDHRMLKAPQLISLALQLIYLSNSIFLFLYRIPIKGDFTVTQDMFSNENLKLEIFVL